jgi:hypothetical protein
MPYLDPTGAWDMRSAVNVGKLPGGWFPVGLQQFVDLVDILFRESPEDIGKMVFAIDAIVGTKDRNPSCGCPRIAQQDALAFGTET